MSFLSHFAGLQPSNTFTGLNADTASLFDGSDTSSIRHYFDSHETHDNNGHHEAQPAYKLSSEEGHDTDLDDFSVGQRAYRDNNSESSGVTDADTPEDRSTVTDNRAPSVELPPAKQRRTNGAPKLASVLMSELAPPEVQLRSSDLTQEQRDDRNLHRKACLVKPNTELPGKNRFWIGVLNPDVNVSRVRKESDFIWMKGHGGNTVRTIWHHWQAQIAADTCYKLQINDEFPPDTTLLEELDFYNDKHVIFRPILQLSIEDD